MTDDSMRFHPWIAAVYDHLNVYFEHAQAPPHRNYLADGLSGRILEIGPGTGSMFPYYDTADGESNVYHGVEPDPTMRQQAAQSATGVAADVTLTAGRAESLPYVDDSFDYCISSCVFCSISDPVAALDEIARVLVDGGEFRFFEHVRSDGPVGYTQDYLTPIWRRFGGNCHLNRELAPLLFDNGQFTITDAAKYAVGHYPIRLFLRGSATVSQ